MAVETVRAADGVRLLFCGVACTVCCMLGVANDNSALVPPPVLYTPPRHHQVHHWGDW
jgi:hypothetical protein